MRIFGIERWVVDEKRSSSLLTYLASMIYLILRINGSTSPSTLAIFEQNGVTSKAG